MPEFIYLIRNGDLHKIGHTKNLKKHIKQLKPDEIILSIEVHNPKGIEARLMKRYSQVRIPDSDYFRLNPNQVNDFQKQLKLYIKNRNTIGNEIGIGAKGSLLLLIAILIIALTIGVEATNAICLALGGGSIPMWIIFFTGNFGGYDLKDVNIFSTWNNRLKGLLIATSFSCAAYTIWELLSAFN